MLTQPAKLVVLDDGVDFVNSQLLACAKAKSVPIKITESVFEWGRELLNCQEQGAPALAFVFVTALNHNISEIIKLIKTDAVLKQQHIAMMGDATGREQDWIGWGVEFGFNYPITPDRVYKLAIMNWPSLTQATEAIEPLDAGPIPELREGRLRDLGSSDNPGLMKELIDSFVSETDGYFRDLAIAAANESETRARDLVELIGGSATTFGFERLGAHCTLFGSAKPDEMIQQVAVMQAVYDSLREKLVRMNDNLIVYPGNGLRK